MKLLPIVALLSLSLAATGCKDPGQAFEDDVCACKDKECMEKTLKEYETKFPESKSTIGEMEKLPADKKAHVEKGMACVWKVGIEAEKKK